MAVGADQIETIVRSTVQLYRAAERALLELVTRYLSQGLDAPSWAVNRLAAVGALRKAAQDLVDQLAADAGPAAAAAAAAVAQAYAAGGDAALAELPDAVAAALAARGALAAVGGPAAVDSLAIALVRDVGVRSSNVVRNVVDVYRQVIAEATAVSTAGGMTRRQASQLAYQRFVDQGIGSFTDASGRRWRLSSYVEMAVRTVTQRAAVQGQTDRQQLLGLPFVMVSDAAQECVRCRPFEGRVLRLGAGPTGSVDATNPATGRPVRVHVVATLDEARLRGLFHPNCRHSVRAYLPGVTTLPPQPTGDPDGDEARQRQRAIERAIRRWKEREVGALDDGARAQAKARIRLWQEQMRKHLAANPGLKRLPYREQIGAGNVPVGR